MNKILKEEELIIDIKEGSKGAFDEFFFKYESKLFAYSFRLTGNTEDAKEIVQEVFIKIWERRSFLDESLNLDGYIFKIAKHIIYNKTRKKLHDVSFKEYYKYTTPLFSPVTDIEVEFNELQKILTTAISDLPQTRRKIFLMSRCYGYTNKQIAEQNDTSVSNVENHINKALRFLKSYLISKEVIVSIAVYFLF